HGPGLHGGLRHVIRQPAVGSSARFGEAMGEQELRVRNEAREPFLLQMARSQVAQQHRDFPVLNQLVGQAGIAARYLFRDDGEALHLARRIELDAAEFLRYPERADADAISGGEYLVRQPALWSHVPFALPVVPDERDDRIVNEVAAALPHHALLFGEV